MAANAVKEFVCPECGFKFQPFLGGNIPTSWQEKIVCPQCGHGVPMSSVMKVQRDVKVNPPGPFEQPSQTKIERKQVSESELLFYLPASGKWGFPLFFAIVWNAISWPAFTTAFLSVVHGKERWSILLFVAIFPLVGAGVAYWSLRSRFAVHLLYLSPDRIRLQRQLFGRRKNFDLMTSRVDSVRKVEFYQQNYQPVYGIEIKSPDGKIRFGSLLSDNEKNWLCWEIREFMKPYAESLV